MVYGMKARSDSKDSGRLSVFVSQEDNRDDELGRIGTLVDAWLIPQYLPEPNLEAAGRFERKLHAAIMASSLRGKVLTFAGLNLWVNDRTPVGIVESQEAINL